MKHDEVRDTVAKAYTRALAASENGGSEPSTAVSSCCGPSVSMSAQLAGYSSEGQEYSDVLQSSFGCGNPLAFSGVEPGEVVLDLGSGAGLDLLIASDKVGEEGRVIGVDMTDAMIEKARETAAQAGRTNIEVRKGVIEELPVEAGTVDWVISNCVINLSPDKPAVFKEIERVLAPSGQISISDIVVEELPEWLRESAHAYNACIGGAISESSYIEGLESAGLVDVEVVERLVYDADQIRGLIATDLAAFGLDPALLEAGLEEVEGKVWSAKFVGRKPD